MTDEQFDLLYEHFKLDNPELVKQDGKARDEEYDLEHDGEIPANEHFDDPEFDNAWSGEEDTEEWEEV